MGWNTDSPVVNTFPTVGWYAIYGRQCSPHDVVADQAMPVEYATVHADGRRTLWVTYSDDGDVTNVDGFKAAEFIRVVAAASDARQVTDPNDPRGEALPVRAYGPCSWWTAWVEQR